MQGRRRLNSEVATAGAEKGKVRAVIRNDMGENGEAINGGKGTIGKMVNGRRRTGGVVILDDNGSSVTTATNINKSNKRFNEKKKKKTTSKYKSALVCTRMMFGSSMHLMR